MPLAPWWLPFAYFPLSQPVFFIPECPNYPQNPEPVKSTAKLGCVPKSLENFRWCCQETSQPVAQRIAPQTVFYRTEQACMDWLRTFSLFHLKRHPAEMGVAEYRAFLIHPAQDG